MRVRIGIMAAMTFTMLTGTSSAQPAFVRKIGDRFVFTVAMSRFVDPSLVGQKLYFPIAPTRTRNHRIYIGSAAVCVGKYSGYPSANGVSVEGRAVRLEQTEAAATNEFGAVVRRESFDVYVLNDCKFSVPDPDALPKVSEEDEHDRFNRNMDAANRQANEQLGKERDACILDLVHKNIIPTPEKVHELCE